MQHSSNLLIRLCFSKRPDPLGCTQLNLDRAVFSLNQRSRTNLAVETPADWTSGRCCVDPLRPPDLSGLILPWNRFISRHYLWTLDLSLFSALLTSVMLSPLRRAFGRRLLQRRTP